MKTLLVVTLAAVLTSACASSDGLQRSKGDQRLAKYEPYVGEPIPSFTAFRPQSWQPVSRTQLVLWTSNSDAYLLTIAGNCPDLMYTDAVRVTSTTSAISTFDSVIVRGDRCPIKQIQPIDVRRMRSDREARQAAS
ncbi:MAG: DUF6491 family protein [Steroidobacteraceae bacterium]